MSSATPLEDVDSVTRPLRLARLPKHTPELSGVATSDNGTSTSVSHKREVYRAVISTRLGSHHFPGRVHGHHHIYVCRLQLLAKQATLAVGAHANISPRRPPNKARHRGRHDGGTCSHPDSQGLRFRQGLDLRKDTTTCKMFHTYRVHIRM